MKNKAKIFTILVIFTVLSSLAGCYLPNPLYGTWTDNDGDKISFMDDGTFSATVTDTTGKGINYEGEWATVDNVLVLNIKGDTEYSRNTEWDIRGAMLYLTWTANGTTKVLTLYHTAR